jgi:dipeptidyl aminopeptidase/acylaminoacyl peptidase
VTVTSTVTRTPTVTQTGTPTPTLARIVFSDQAANGLYNLFSMDINGGDVRLLATSAPAANVGLTAWDASPDGRWLVVELDGNPRQLALLRLDGSVPLKSLPAQPAADNDLAAWSPDSQWIVFHSAQDGSLYAIRSDGSDLRRLTNEAVDDTHPSWSPDGQNLIYAAGGDLWTLDTSGLYLPTLTATPNGAPPPAETDIPTPLPAPQKLSYSSSNAEDSPRYSPDGKVVLFARSVDGVWQLFRAVLWQVEALPGANAAGFNQQMPAWSSDGQYVVFVSDRSGTPQIYRIKSDGSGLAQLTAHAVTPIWPVWLP